jgi:hypothetical protein
MVKKPDPGSGSWINNLDDISEYLTSVFWVKILKIFYADPGIRDCKIRIRDGKIRIRDKHPGSASLQRRYEYVQIDAECVAGTCWPTPATTRTNTTGTETRAVSKSGAFRPTSGCLRLSCQPETSAA